MYIITIKHLKFTNYLINDYVFTILFYETYHKLFNLLG